MNTARWSSRPAPLGGAARAAAGARRRGCRRRGGCRGSPRRPAGRRPRRPRRARRRAARPARASRAGGCPGPGGRRGRPRAARAGAGAQRPAGGAVEFEVQLHLASSSHTLLDLERAKSRHGPGHGRSPPQPVQRARCAGRPPAPTTPRDDRRDPRRGARGPPWLRRDGQPYVIPTLHARIGDEVYVHGSAASRMPHHARRRLVGVPDRHARRRAALARSRSITHELHRARSSCSARARFSSRAPTSRAAVLQALHRTPGPRSLGRGAPALAPQQLRARACRAAHRRGVGGRCAPAAARRRRGRTARRMPGRGSCRRPSLPASPVSPTAALRRHRRGRRRVEAWVTGARGGWRGGVGLAAWCRDGRR